MKKEENVPRKIQPANKFNKFEKIRGQIKALHEEISTLSKKKPDDGINPFKLRFINQILSEANGVLKKEYLPKSDFRTFDEENLPTNSDVVIMLSQYLECFSRQSIDGSPSFPFDL